MEPSPERQVNRSEQTEEPCVPISRLEDIFVDYIVSELQIQSDAQREALDGIERVPRNSGFKWRVLSEYEMRDYIRSLSRVRINALDHFAKTLESKTGFHIAFKKLYRIAESRIEDQ